MSSVSEFGAQCISAFPFPFRQIDRVCSVLRSRGFKRVVLQFPDENLEHSVNVYDYMLENLNGKSKADSGNCMSESVSRASTVVEEDFVDIFITADSTYGSSVDDISAEHVSAEILIYFGSDLSSSGAMPVMVVPAQVDIDVQHCADCLFGEIVATLQKNPLTPILMLFEPGCEVGARSVHSVISQQFPSKSEGPHIACIELARLPSTADLDAWAAGDEKSLLAPEDQLLGGLKVPKRLLDGEVRCRVLYIGDKDDQLKAMQLQLGLHEISAYSPKLRSVTTSLGESSRAFRERYGGVSRVKEAKVVGLVVGSMGLTGVDTRDLISRLQTLANAAHKKTYTFVMGRLNEAKLCNFPEIDIFVFISNEDVSIIPPKTFHVPVLTPWEFEIGLGARPWKSCYMSSATAVLDGDVQEAVALAIEALSDDELNEEVEAEEEANFVPVEDRYSSSRALVTTEAQQETRLQAFSSPAGDFLQRRPYQGLMPEAPVGQSLDIHKGLVGIASSYSLQKD